MNQLREITVIQTTCILISTIIGVGVLPLPLFGVKAADTGAPLVTFLAIMIAFLGLWVITKLGIRFPNQSIIQYSETIIGKWPARICNFLVIAFFLLLTGLGAREFGEVVVTAVLRETPIEVTVIVMLLMAAIPARNDINIFSYIHVFFLPVILSPGLIIVALSLKNANVLYLQPLWGHDHKVMILGILTIAALFQGTFIITILIPYMRRPKKAMKASLWAIGIAGTFYLLIVIAAVSVFGPEEIKQLLWPTLELARTTSWGRVLQRLDVIFLVVWVTAVFTTLYSSYLFMAFSISQFFHLRDHKMLSYFLLPLVFVIAMYPKNSLKMYEVIVLVGTFGLILTIIYPCVLLVMAILRKQEGHRTIENG
ncbi:GerAB/ArcD/ProY family transporter [Fictibacillus terranigra]|uniref:Endospore germination permease n=1 Tax=Fictibacillus terranigra TaxID=3058424 RepID=A0ABT8EBJ7_9BACL|nr:endospore germination permease [Fictibacillus sp. CENA-BCM004]MDN4075288.1 endospore germination permease [Fictibacillus sp. CENA-BCM004]